MSTKKVQSSNPLDEANTILGYAVNNAIIETNNRITQKPFDTNISLQASVFDLDDQSQREAISSCIEKAFAIYYKGEKDPHIDFLFNDDSPQGHYRGVARAHRGEILYAGLKDKFGNIGLCFSVFPAYILQAVEDFTSAGNPNFEKVINNIEGIDFDKKDIAWVFSMIAANMNIKSLLHEIRVVEAHPFFISEVLTNLCLGKTVKGNYLLTRLQPASLRLITKHLNKNIAPLSTIEDKDGLYYLGALIASKASHER